MKIKIIVLGIIFVLVNLVNAAVDYDIQKFLGKINVSRGICAILADKNCKLAIELVKNKKALIVFVQLDTWDELKSACNAASNDGLYGTSIFVSKGGYNKIHLADNLADAVIAPVGTLKNEVLRILGPTKKGYIGEEEISKEFPVGIEWWDHFYYKPDNSCNTKDTLARAPYLTQFMGNPKWCPYIEVTVAAGGKIFRAYGHVATHRNQNSILNTLFCINAYNGIIEWKRTLKNNFLLRNTMIATENTLYFADKESCKLIDINSGQIRKELVISSILNIGTVWKWMAKEGNMLYALIGGEERTINTYRSNEGGYGHFGWNNFGVDGINNPSTGWCFGKAIIAIDLKANEIRWIHKENEFIDSRGICMRNGKIYFYAPGKFLKCISKEGIQIWTNSNSTLTAAIGNTGGWGFITESYIRCNDNYIFFSGTQKSKVVAVSTTNGNLVWQKSGDYQIILDNDVFYAIGPQVETSGGVPWQKYEPLQVDKSFKINYNSWQEVGKFRSRRGCTRVTGNLDSLFFRTKGGTVVIDKRTLQPQYIAPIRPACISGVIISNGHFYWGPWMCNCEIGLYGHICLSSAGNFNFKPDNSNKLELEPNGTVVTNESSSGNFEANDKGIITNGNWKFYTGGRIAFNPVVYKGRVYAGSADGYIYALEVSTGRLLWRFKAAPADRWIYVYGKLMSTWPVMGGVVINNGILYGAAGIAHYDGTYVYALNPIDGSVRLYNNTSGELSESVKAGISLQGRLSIVGNELQFPGGNMYNKARYSLQDLKCLNEPRNVPAAENNSFSDIYYPSIETLESIDKIEPVIDGTIEKKELNEIVFIDETKLSNDKVYQNYPNPFNPECYIPYELKESGDVKIRIYNILGQKVRELELGKKQEGKYITKDRAAYWDGKNNKGNEVVSGVYYYELVIDGKVIGMKKSLVLK